MLREITITGFKSFAKKTVLDFGAPITAIVGPNGSGKSNVVEAMRFVLGEQSMKGLRSKSGGDLIFKGGKFLPAERRAKILLAFDNKKRTFKIGQNINVDFDEIRLAREVYQDGINVYSINDSEVRLKDINELLSSVGLGTSGHNIISQGEADRILNASGPDRKEMIEDALSLRVYKYRLRESERKLRKTEENLKETELIRREITPHLKFLKKQVEKIEEREKLKTDLATLAISYFGSEDNYLKQEFDQHIAEKNVILEKLKTLEKDGASNKENVVLEEEREITENKNKLKEMGFVKEDLKRRLGRFEGMIEVKEASLRSSEERTISIDALEVKKFITDLIGYIDFALDRNKTLLEIRPALEKVQAEAKNFLSQFSEKNGRDILVYEIDNIKKSKDAILNEIKEIDNKENELRNRIAILEKELKTKQEATREAEKRKYETIMEIKELKNTLEIVRLKEETVVRSTFLLNEDKKEILAIIPGLLFPVGPIVERTAQEDRRRQIERLKIRLEDVGVPTADIVKEHEELQSREEFLAHEIEDLKKSIVSLQEIMESTQSQIEDEFKIGLVKISETFSEFFTIIFGGGEARLVETKEEKREDEESETENKIEKGIEISVKLPHKKTRELHALSGGERSLISIALLFAMSSVNPPPFLVLDETDAALDEANSKRYGDMLNKLSNSTQLIVVTHNRETMSRASILYGVTMQGDGVSKVLSVKFDEAVAIAK